MTEQFSLAGNPASVAVVGALSHDLISTTETLFSDHGAGLNCKLDGYSEHFGGCGGNIAYAMAQLGRPSSVLSSAGSQDIGNYQKHLASLNINLEGLLVIDGHNSARALIITDPEGRQFTGFAPGPEIDAKRWQQHLDGLAFSQTRIFVCAPFPDALMLVSLKHVQQNSNKALRIWCPGQYADALPLTALKRYVGQWEVLVGNQHEISYLRRICPDLLAGALVLTTDGPKPIKVSLPDGSRRTYPVPQPICANPEPTGCGDAFLGGFVAELERQGVSDVSSLIHNLSNAIRSGTHLAQHCLNHPGCQGYSVITAANTERN